MAQATSGGATMEPTDAPMLYTPPARPRSFAGNHSAVAFMPAGLADPSANPRRPRSHANACQLPASACAMFTTDQEIAKMANPILRSEEHTSELQSHVNLVCRLLLEKKKTRVNL